LETPTAAEERACAKGATRATGEQDERPRHKKDQRKLIFFAARRMNCFIRRESRTPEPFGKLRINSRGGGQPEEAEADERRGRLSPSAQK